MNNRDASVGPHHDAAQLVDAIWRTRYRAAEFDERATGDSFLRVARSLARPERERDHWQQRFLQLMAENRFLPGGRILANAGRDSRATLANCFVAGKLIDSMDGIFRTLRDSALTLQAGGGIGVDFSPLRPRLSAARSCGRVASGPVSYLAVWNQMSATLFSTNPRQGAMMGVLDISHPDILEFIDAKRETDALPHFNLSVLASDAFMQALQEGRDWPLRFRGRQVGRVDAGGLWQALLRGGLAGGEPGLLFIDRVNRCNRLRNSETIRCTNPCGELPLPPHGSCLLGSLVLPTFVLAPGTGRARLDTRAIEECTATAVRMLDNALDQARLPLPGQRREAHRSRRLGIGITGLGDMLAMLGLRYDSDGARDAAATVAACVRHAAYNASCELAVEKEAFPTCNAAAWLDSPDTAPLPSGLENAIRRSGLRNSHLTAIAPAGSISLLAGGVSSGIEPVFDWDYERQFAAGDGGGRTLRVTSPAVTQWQSLHGETPLPSQFVRSEDIGAADQVAMVAALQPWIDSGISKTVALPSGFTDTQLDTLYRQAWSSGLKGLAVYPTTAARGAVLRRGCGDACDDPEG